MRIFAAIVFSLIPFCSFAGHIADTSFEIIKSVEDYYIREISPNKTGSAMIKALRKIDASFNVRERNGRLLLSYEGMVLGRYNPPKNAREWAAFIEDTVLLLRGHSYKISALTGDKVMEIIAGQMLAELDAYSYYSRMRKAQRQSAKTRPPQITVTSENYGSGQKTAKKAKEGYLTLAIESFDENTPEQVRRTVQQFSLAVGKNFKGIVVDLRGNKGGALLPAVKTADLFLDNVMIASVKGRNEASFQDYRAGDGQIALGIPIIVLVNSSTASSAELFAAALQENRRAKVVGETTYGKSSVQTGVPLTNGGEVVLTWAHFLTANGLDIEGKGVIPDKRIYTKVLY